MISVVKRSYGKYFLKIFVTFSWEILITTTNTKVLTHTQTYTNSSRQYERHSKCEYECEVCESFGVCVWACFYLGFTKETYALTPIILWEFVFFGLFLCLTKKEKKFRTKLMIFKQLYILLTLTPPPPHTLFLLSIDRYLIWFSLLIFFGPQNLNFIVWHGEVHQDDGIRF